MNKLSIQEEFNCQGYFGFGDGVVMARKKTRHGGSKITLGCQSCLITQNCWEAHKNRVRKSFPELTKALDQIAENHTGTAYFEECQRQFGTEFKEPYMLVMMGNIEDALNIQLTGRPKDKGDLTIPYPFKK